MVHFMVHSVVVDTVSADLSTSPIFPCRQPTSQPSAVNASHASGSVSRFQDTNYSPWLSKEQGISNGKAAQTRYELQPDNFVFIVLPRVVIGKYDSV